MLKRKIFKTLSTLSIGILLTTGIASCNNKNNSNNSNNTIDNNTSTIDTDNKNNTTENPNETNPGSSTDVNPGTTDDNNITYNMALYNKLDQGNEVSCVRICNSANESLYLSTLYSYDEVYYKLYDFISKTNASCGNMFGSHNLKLNLNYEESYLYKNITGENKHLLGNITLEDGATTYGYKDTYIGDYNTIFFENLDELYVYDDLTRFGTGKYESINNTNKIYERYGNTSLDVDYAYSNGAQTTTKQRWGFMLPHYDNLDRTTNNPFYNLYKNNSKSFFKLTDKYIIVKEYVGLYMSILNDGYKEALDSNAMAIFDDYVKDSKDSYEVYELWINYSKGNPFVEYYYYEDKKSHTQTDYSLEEKVIINDKTYYKKASGITYDYKEIKCNKVEAIYQDLNITELKNNFYKKYNLE